MNEPMRKYLQTGLIHFMAFPETQKGEGPILETLKKIILDEFFDVVAISWIKDPAVRKKAKRMLQMGEMRVVYGAHPALLTQKLSLNDADEAGRRKAIDEMKRGLDEAFEMNAESFVFLSGPFTPGKEEEALNRLIDSTNEICAYAKSLGEIKLALEVFDYNVDKKSLIGPAALAKRYAETIRREYKNFGLVVDLSHTPIIGETPRDALLPVRDCLSAVDIGNCLLTDKQSPRYGDHHPWFCYPGGENGVEQLVEFLRVLLEIGFINTEKPPVVSFEVKPMEDDDPEIVIANAKRTLERAWVLV